MFRISGQKAMQKGFRYIPHLPVYLCVQNSDNKPDETGIDKEKRRSMFSISGKKAMQKGSTASPHLPVCLCVQTSDKETRSNQNRQMEEKMNV